MLSTVGARWTGTHSAAVEEDNDVADAVMVMVMMVVIPIELVMVMTRLKLLVTRQSLLA